MDGQRKSEIIGGWGGKIAPAATPLPFEPLQEALAGCSVFSPSELAFLIQFVTDFSQRPGERERAGQIAQNLIDFTQAEPALRPSMAVVNLAQTPRHGLVRRGIPQPQTVFEHYTALARFARDYEHPELDTPGVRERVVDMLMVHDLIEGITTDFSPRCLSDDREKGLAIKTQLEETLAKLLFEDPMFEDKKALFEDFEASEALPARIALAFDKAEAVINAANYDRCGIRRADGKPETLYDDFISTDREKIANTQTGVGADLLDRLDHDREALLEEYASAEANTLAGRRSWTMFVHDPEAPSSPVPGR